MQGLPLEEPDQVRRAMPPAFEAAVDDIVQRIEHPEQSAFFAYWLERVRDGRLPGRKDLDPLDFPSLLPRIALIDVLRDGTGAGDADGAGGMGFRYRLAGTEIANRAKRDPTGKTFQDLYSGDYLQQAQALYVEIVENGLPHLSERIYPVEEGKETLRYHRLVLPLAADGRTIDMIVLLIVVIDQTRLDDALEAFQ
jgi:hypothetical protein